MNTVKFFLVVLFLFLQTHLFAQIKLDTIPANEIVSVKFNCPDTAFYVSNMGQAAPCEFLFHRESPTLYYVEDFSNRDFAALVYGGNFEVIKHVKIVALGYKPQVHHFVYAWTKDNLLVYYYFLKDAEEERRFVH